MIDPSQVGELIPCDRCGEPGAYLGIVPHRIICAKCAATSECSSCGKAVPRYDLTIGDDPFCEACCHNNPRDLW